MEKLEKFLDKKELANATGDSVVLDIINDTMREQMKNQLNIENYDKIVEILELLYATNVLIAMAETYNGVASEHYTEIENLYTKIKQESCELVGYEKLWSYEM